MITQRTWNATIDSAALRVEQERTLSSPRRRGGVLAKLLFFWMNMCYGRRRTLSKFKVLEVIARVPYQAWENVAYIAVTHTYRRPHFARRIFEFVKESRAQQDNEQWHLLILEEMVQNKGLRENFFWYRLVPQMMAFLYYHISWLLYVMKPGWSYALNADFEDHAEHEYMTFVQENSALDTQPFESEFKEDYGQIGTCGDLFRRIGLDERMHKQESLYHMEHPRFA